MAAAERLRGVAHRTPVVTSRTLDARTGAQVFLKCENLQRMGAFKFRGAYNRIAQLDAEARRGGVVAEVLAEFMTDDDLGGEYPGGLGLEPLARDPAL